MELIDYEGELDRLRCRDYQKNAVIAAINAWEGCRSTLIVLPTGCHEASQGILMWDGSIRHAASIAVGDLLMGPDSLPRQVLSLVRGLDQMYQITPTKGKPWIVNGDHVLSLVATNTNSAPKYPSEAGGKIVNVTVREWLTWSKHKKHIHKLYRTAVEFPETGGVLLIDPYVMGVVLGDGCITQSVVVHKPSQEIRDEFERIGKLDGFAINEHNKQDGDCPAFGVISDCNGRNSVLEGLRILDLYGTTSETKFIPQSYKTATLEDRLRLLAGLMDTDGSVTGSGFDYISKSKTLAEDIAFVCRSVGLAAYVKHCVKSCQNGFTGVYYRVGISGDCSIIPTLIPEKKAQTRTQKKSVLRTGFTIHRTGYTDNYFGWTVTGDNLYLLDDFTVTHNCGKTHVGGSLCRIWEQHKDGRILWIAHRKELIEQAAGRIALLTGTQPEIEMADQRAEKHSLLADSSVVVASIQSLMAGRKCKTCDATGGILDICPHCHGEGCEDSKCEGRGSIATDVDCPFCLGGRIRRLQKFRPEEFSLIVYDECHHATSSTNRRVKKWFEKNENARFLGLTATADRSDGAALGQVFQTVAINIELPYAIDNGWLVPIVQKSITCEHLDFSNVRTTAGDLNGRDLEDILATEETLHEMVAPTVQLAGDRRTLVFCVDKTHTKLVCELINRYKKESANYILGDTKDEEREELIAQHKAGKFQFMVGCGVFTEGYDDPGIQVVAIMRPTKSRALYVQMCGRGTRPIDPPTAETPEERKAAIAASVKPSLLILDYVGNAGRHKLITALNLFEGKYSDDILDRAKRIADEADEELPTEELVRRAQEQIDEEERKRQELEEARKREWMKAREVKFNEELVDPFGWWDTLPQRIGAAKKGRQATDNQINALLRMGVEPLRLEELSFSEASVMMNTLVERRKKGLCTYKQSKHMLKHNINPDVSFATASRIMDAIARNGWKCNDSIRAMAHQQTQEASR